MQLPRVLFLSSSSLANAKHAQMAKQWFHCQPAGAYEDTETQQVLDAAKQPALVFEVGLGLVQFKAGNKPGLQPGWYPAVLGVCHGPKWGRLGSLLQDWPDAVVVDGSPQSQQLLSQLEQLRSLGVTVHTATGPGPGCPAALAKDLWHPAGRCQGATQRSCTLQQACRSAGLADETLGSMSLQQLQQTVAQAAEALRTAEEWPLQQQFRQECAAQMLLPGQQALSQDELDQLVRERIQRAPRSLQELPSALRLVHQLLSLDSASARIAAFSHCIVSLGSKRWVPLGS